MSFNLETSKVNVNREEGLPMDWERIAILAATIAILFFYTRSTPFPTGTYWDLLFARDFDLNIGWAILPEALSFSIVQSTASMVGLKTVYHIAYFLLCCIVAVWVFKGKEVLPGIVVLCVFALGLQSILSLRWTLQLLFLAGLICMFEGDFLKGSFGVALIPVLAAASALGLNSWLLLGLIVCHVLVNDEFRLTLILCGLIGILFFPEGAASAVVHTPLSSLFQTSEDGKTLALLGAIFLIPNLLGLARLGEEDLPTLIFYAFSGLVALLDPTTLPVFTLVGAYMVFLNLAEIQPLSSNVRLVGIIFLAIVLHLSLFMNPIGFSLNPSVRGEIGPSLVSMMTTNYEKRPIDVHDMGELAWKGLVEISAEDIPVLLSQKTRPITIMNRNGSLEWFPSLPPDKIRGASDKADFAVLEAPPLEPGNTWASSRPDETTGESRYPPPRVIESISQNASASNPAETEPAPLPEPLPEPSPDSEPIPELAPSPEPAEPAAMPALAPGSASTLAPENQPLDNGEDERLMGPKQTEGSAPIGSDSESAGTGTEKLPVPDSATTGSGSAVDLSLPGPIIASDPLDGIPAPIAPEPLSDDTVP